MTTEIIKFDKKDLLNFDELERLIITVLPNEKAEIISKKLLNYLLIFNGKYFSFDIENVLYKEEQNDKNYVISIITLFIDKSYGNLSQRNKELLQLKYKKCVNVIFSNKNVNDYMPQLKTYLTNNKACFDDPHLCEIHFINGYFDFKKGEFLKRIKGVHFIHTNINRIYTPKNNKEMKRVMHDIKKIYKNKDDRNYLLMQLGIALTGLSCSDQTMLFLLGRGSTGKSTIMDMCKASLDKYVLTLPKQTFSKGYSKIDKVLNTYIERPCIRLSHVNEMEDTKIDDSLFKDHTDGKIQTTSLYKDGANDFKHHSKMVFTLNTMLKMKTDSGSQRRIDSYTHMSNFVDNIKDVDESKNIYLKNKNFISDIENDIEYVNAFFHILTDYALGWMNKTAIFKQTQNFRDTKDAIISTNDIIQDFIDKTLTITENVNDRIGREEMHELFKSIYPKSFITPTDLLNTLKDKNMIYKADYRHNKIKGCYLYVTVDNCSYDTNPALKFPDENNEDKNLEEIYKLKLKEKDDKIKELLKRIKKLEMQKENNIIVNDKVKKEKKQSETLDKFIDEIDEIEDFDMEEYDDSEKYNTTYDFDEPILTIKEKNIIVNDKIKDKKNKIDKYDIIKQDEDEIEIKLCGETFNTNKNDEFELNLNDIEDMLNDEVKPQVKTTKNKKSKNK